MADFKIDRIDPLGYLRPPSQRGEALSLAEQIASQLAGTIILGDYSPGERIHESLVSERFSVSRGPVREALRILDKQGLVRIQPRRGAIVTKLTVQEVEDVFEIRGGVFAIAGRRATQMRDPALIEALKKGVSQLADLQKMDDYGDVTDAYLAKTQELNLLLCSQTSSDLLVSIMYSLLHQTMRYTRLGLSTKDRRRQSLKNWRNLLKSIEKGDTRGAETAISALVGRSKDMAIKLLQEENQKADQQQPAS